MVEGRPGCPVAAVAGLLGRGWLGAPPTPGTSPDGACAAAAVPKGGGGAVPSGGGRERLWVSSLRQRPCCTLWDLVRGVRGFGRPLLLGPFRGSQNSSPNQALMKQGYKAKVHGSPPDFGQFYGDIIIIKFYNVEKYN